MTPTLLDLARSMADLDTVSVEDCRNVSSPGTRPLTERLDQLHDLPFDRPGRFWRGHIHTHSDRSDGALPPEEVRKPGFITILGAELHAPRTEFSTKWHIIAVGLPLGFAPPCPGESGPELARRARAAGAFIGMAHPAASLLTLPDAESLDAAHAVEVYNALSAREDRADIWHLCDVLLGRGRRLTAYAADDAHFQPQDPPACAARVHVRAESLDPAALLAALTAGHYYASTGPELHEIRLPDGQLTVYCSPARKVLLTGCVPGAEVIQGEALTQCSLPLTLFKARGYCRVTVEDATGGRALEQSDPAAPARIDMSSRRQLPIRAYRRLASARRGSTLEMRAPSGLQVADRTVAVQLSSQKKSGCGGR